MYFFHLDSKNKNNNYNPSSFINYCFKSSAGFEFHENIRDETQYFYCHLTFQ